MSIPRNFWAKFWGVSARTRQIFCMLSRNVLKYSDFIFYVATTKSNNPQCFHICCFCCYLLPQQKNVVKMLPNNKGKFLFRKLFSKSLSNVSKYKKVTLVTGRGGNTGTTYVFASYRFSWNILRHSLA